MEWYHYILVVGVGLLAGIINTLAGGGSMLTLPVLMALGLPPNVANGTNRIAILLQNVVGVGRFVKKKRMDLPSGWRVGLPAAAGAILGASIAVQLNDEVMKMAIAGVMVLVFFMILLQPGRWLQESGEHKALPYWLQVIVYFLVGVYGGFIQAGVGFFLLTALVLGSAYDLVKANALKLFVILLYTPVALVIFFMAGDVNLVVGLVLAVGNMAGAWIGTHLAMEKGARFIRYVVLLALLGAAVKLLLEGLGVI